MLASARRAVPRVSAALRGLGTVARPHLPSTFALAPPSLPPPHRPVAAPPPLWWPAVGLDEPVLHKLAGAPLPLIEDETTNQLELVMPGGLTGASRPALPCPPGAAMSAASANVMPLSPTRRSDSGAPVRRVGEFGRGDPSKEQKGLAHVPAERLEAQAHARLSQVRCAPAPIAAPTPAPCACVFTDRCPNTQAAIDKRGATCPGPPPRKGPLEDCGDLDAGGRVEWQTLAPVLLRRAMGVRAYFVCSSSATRNY